MMKDSMNLYKNSKYLNIECYSCGSVEHEISYCPNIHITIDRAKVIEKYLEDEAEFKRTFVRRQRQRFNTFKSIEQLNEAATQFQMGHQTEIQYSIDSSDPEEEEMGAVSSYSSLDEVLDRKIYDPHPLDYVEDTDNVKILDMSRNYVHISKKNRQKVGQIETFMKNNYDPYYHNLNLDRVKNFEVYYPNNNIAKLMIEFEKRRLEKIVEMRLGIRAKHLCTFLAQGVRNTERKNTQAQSLVPIQKRISLKKQISLRKQMSLRRKEKKPPASPRRDSASSNPGDIVLYSSKSAKNLKPSQYKINQPMVPQTLSNGSYLDPNSSTKQRDYENSLNKIGRSKDLELSTIKEHSYDRLEIADGVRGRLSVDYSPMSLMPTESKASMIAASRKKINGSIDALLLGTLIKTPENGSSPSHHLLQDNIKETYSKDSEPLGETGREIERSQDAATIDYSKLINKIHDKDLNTKLTIRSEKEVSSVEEKSLLQYLRINEGSAKAFQQALQGRKKEEKKKRKLRASSESQRNKVNYRNFCGLMNFRMMMRRMSHVRFLKQRSRLEVCIRKPLIFNTKLNDSE